MTTTVTLLRDLPQFPIADTGAPRAGTLLVGTLEALAVEVRGTDEYVQIGTWICAKSNGVTYAVIDTPTPPVTDGISEKALTDTLNRFANYSYSGSNPRYTGPLPNVTLPIEPPKQNNCCVFVEDLVVHGFQLAGWPFLWDLHRHEQLMIANWNDIWSPPYGVSEPGLAGPVVPQSSPAVLPPPWSVCQGWGPTSGHTFIVLAAHAATGKVLVLESNNAFGMNGPGFRGLGDLDKFLPNGPPADWFTYPDVPTWADMHARYSTGIALAPLKVLTSTLVWGRS